MLWELSGANVMYEFEGPPGIAFAPAYHLPRTGELAANDPELPRRNVRPHGYGHRIDYFHCAFEQAL
jgi:hypothetical protein